MNEKRVREAADKLVTAVRKAQCSRCYNHNTNDLADALQKALAPPHRFYVGQQALVSSDESRWKKAKVFGMGGLNNKFFLTDIGSFRNCKPDPEAVSLPNWIPVEVDVVWADDENKLVTSPDGKHYCIIPLPQWID